MKKTFFILICILVQRGVSYGQFSDQNWWFFGDAAGVDFSSGTAVGVNIPAVTMYTDEPVACYSNPTTGNLIFYTNGQSVYRSDHSVLTSALNGSPNSVGIASSTQGALIIPKIADPNKYYIFYTSDVTAGACINYGLRYSIVDFTTPAGSVVSLNLPAIPMPGYNLKTTEHLMAIPHCNGTDYWIIVHCSQTGSNDKFLVFGLTAAGLSAPVQYSSFPVTPWAPSMSPATIHNWMGFIKASPDGRKLAVTNFSSTVYLYDFDKQTGSITAASTITCPFTLSGGWIYGLSFSPNSNQLYIGKETALFQYDVTNLAAPVLNPNSNSLALFAHRLQLGPDNKIYMNDAYSLSVINYPDNVNNSSNAIGYSSASVSLLSHYCALSLPNVIDAKKPVITSPVFISTFNTCNEVTFNTPDCAASYTWNFGDGTIITTSNPSPVHAYASSGSYTVTLTIGSYSSNQTIQILPAVIPISGPTTWCNGSMPPTYSTGPYTGYTYNWTATTGTFITPSNNSSTQVNWTSLGANTIDVTVTQDGCTSSNSLGVTVYSSPTASAGPTVDACSSPVIGGSPTATGGLAPYTYSWSPSLGLSSTIIANPIATPLTTTNYTVMVTDGNGCTASAVCTVTVGNDSWHQTTELTTGSEIYNDVITDREGNVYAVGTYTKSTTLNGGGNPDMTINSGVAMLTNNSFVAKYDACGNLIWVANSTDFTGCTGIGITLDENSGMVYITGNFDQIMRFSSAASYNGLCTVPNTLTILTPGSNRGYVAQFDMVTGCLYFLAPLTLNTSSTLESRAITANENTDDIYIGGQYKSSARNCAFIVKYTPTTTMGTSNTLNPIVWSVVGDNTAAGYDKINDLDYNEVTNRLYGIGDFSINAKLVPGSVSLSTGNKDAFICAYADLGITCTQALFSKGGISGTNEMYGEGIAVDESGNLAFLTGTFKGSTSVPFNLPGITALTATNEAAYMIGVNFTASTSWSKKAEVPVVGGKAFGKEVSCFHGRAYFVGEFTKSTVNIQSVGSFPFLGGLSGAPNFHVFTAAYGSTGTGVNGNVTKSTGSIIDNHLAQSIAANESGHCFVVGQYSPNLNYLNGGVPPSAPLVATGGPNAYVMRTLQTTGEYKIAEHAETDSSASAFTSTPVVYPNPTNAEITLVIKGFVQTETKQMLTVFNAMGQVVKTFEITSENTLIDLSSYQNGIYLFSVSNGSTAHVVRVSKTN